MADQNTKSSEIKGPVKRWDEQLKELDGLLDKYINASKSLLPPETNFKVSARNVVEDVSLFDHQKVQGHQTEQGISSTKGVRSNLGIPPNKLRKSESKVKSTHRKGLEEDRANRENIPINRNLEDDNQPLRKSGDHEKRLPPLYQLRSISKRKHER